MNIADTLTKFAKTNPHKDAIRYKEGKISFEDLERLSNTYAHGLRDMGFSSGDKTLLFVRPSLKFHALVFALFKIGVVPLFIDPAMGRKNLLEAIKEVRPTGLIAEPEVHFLSLLFRSAFSCVKLRVTTSSCSFGLSTSLRALEKASSIPVTTKLDPEELAAILFTSGGTGRPKGVMYTHKIFSQQTKNLQKLFSLTPDDIDLPGFPLFSLFTLTMGMTSCIPDMDPSKPGEADPVKLLKNIQDHNPTFVAGSPAIWKNLSAYCLKYNIILPSVKYLVMFGAPIRNEVHEDFSKILPNGSTYTPYGATESLPVANISGREILAQTADLTNTGHGTCVGSPAPGMLIKIIKVTDDAIAEIAKVKELGVNEIGEIIVKGDVVTKEYFNSPLETKKAKITDGNSFWHRMGDMGKIDERGRLWFCGRKAHRAETPNGLVCSVNSEALFNVHESVNKSALVAIGEMGSQNIAMVIERSVKGKKVNQKKLKSDLLKLAKTNNKTADIKSIHFHDNFPVDVRHNIKIDRIKLANAVKAGEI